MTATLTAEPTADTPLYEQPTRPVDRDAFLARDVVAQGASHLEVRHRVGTYLHQHRAPFRAVIAAEGVHHEATVLGLRVIDDVVHLCLADTLLRFDTVTALAV